MRFIIEVKSPRIKVMLIFTSFNGSFTFCINCPQKLSKRRREGQQVVIVHWDISSIISLFSIQPLFLTTTYNPVANLIPFRNVFYFKDYTQMKFLAISCYIAIQLLIFLSWYTDYYIRRSFCACHCIKRCKKKTSLSMVASNKSFLF